MAEVISVDAPSPSGSVATKTGRHSRFTAEENLVLLREVSAANAHVAAFGENGKRYGDAASNFNANPTVAQTVTWKSVRDRYKRPKEQFDKRDNANQFVSGVGRESGEMEELLMEMQEARDDLAVQKTAKKTTQQETDREKEMIGQELVEMSLKRRTADHASKESMKDVPASAKKTKRLKQMESGGEMERFGAHLRDADLARIELEREKLAFKRGRSEADRAEREREERREEREKMQELELIEYKLLIGALNKK